MRVFYRLIITAVIFIIWGGGFKGNKKKEKTWINLLDILNFL